MRRPTLALLAALVAAPFAFSAPPKLAAPKVEPANPAPGDEFTVTVPLDAATKFVNFKPRTAGLVDRGAFYRKLFPNSPLPPGVFVGRAAAAGKYSLLIYGGGDAGGDDETITITVGASPTPAPPTPTPVATDKWVVIVRDPATAPPGVEGWTSVVALGKQAKVYKPADDAVKENRYDQAAADKKLGGNYVLVINPDGHLNTAFPLPATSDVLAAALAPYVAGRR